MDLSPAVSTRINRIVLTLSNLLIAIITSGFAFLGGAAILMFGLRLAYSDLALPGVGTGGMNLAGMDATQIESGLSLAYDYPQAGMIGLRDGDNLWEAKPADLGVAIDVAFMTQQVLAVGRTGTLQRMAEAQIQAWLRGIQIPPRVIFDERIANVQLQSLAVQIDLPTLEASLELSGLEVEVHSGQIGRRLDIQATLDAMGGHNNLHARCHNRLVDRGDPTAGARRLGTSGCGTTDTQRALDAFRRRCRTLDDQPG